MSDTPITNRVWDEVQYNPADKASDMRKIAADLEFMCNELYEALMWYHGGEPLPTLADAAIAKYKAMKAAK